MLALTEIRWVGLMPLSTFEMEITILFTTADIVSNGLSAGTDSLELGTDLLQLQ